jgi:Icc-related predicted phosphoesterase
MVRLNGGLGGQAHAKMKILAISDRPMDFIYSLDVVERFPHVDLLIGCGDLPEDYLEFLVSVYNVPLVFVPGNHDRDRYVVPGGISADGKLLWVDGLAIMGLGGSRRYEPRGRHQYTETEMCLRVSGLLLRMLLRPQLWTDGVDMIISHAPPRDVHDADDLPHQGFSCYHPWMRISRPSLFLHGHSHILDRSMRSETHLHDVRILNVFPYRVVELQSPS